jgi:glycosyltransferase involved in cell wall biosynthesis
MTGFSFLSTYPPTRCGLATFTESLATAMTRTGEADARVIRMMDELAQPATAAIGTRTSIVGELTSVDAADDAAIRQAARSLSASDVAIVQHEYGIFGGPDGSDAIRVMQLLMVPSVVVLHTVLDAPTAGQRSVLEKVVLLAGAVVVMTATALERLGRHYAVDLRKVSVIPHGVPDWPAGHGRVGGRRSVLTWGLIGPGKGIEHGIRAIAALGDPDVRYVVAGQTHPKVVAQEGEAYRESLHALVSQLGLGDRVRIVDDYLDAVQLAALVGSADAVLLPYDSRDQVTSGVLVEAIAAGKPVVATAFPHAVELLTEGVGRVVAHEDHVAIADALRAVLARPRSSEDSPGVPPAPTGTTWADVAPRYRELANTLIARSLERSA